MNCDSNNTESYGSCIEIKTDNICAKGRHPEDILSNLCNNDFCFDGVQCGCMESFLQSLKCQDADEQRKICILGGGEIKEHPIYSKETDKTFWWKGRSFERNSPEFEDLIRSAFEAMYLWCGRFRDALMATLGKQLRYDSCTGNTILTDQKFCKILIELRENRKDEYKQCIYPRLWPNSYGVDEDYV